MQAMKTFEEGGKQLYQGYQKIISRLRKDLGGKLPDNNVLMT